MSRDRLKESYKKFCSAEGNHHIASEYAILKLQELTDSFKVKSVLEVGLGIGAITGCLLSANKHLRYSGTEENAFCLDALKYNLAESYDRLEVFTGISKVPVGKFDLLIIDGKDPDLENIQQLVANSGIIAIEGDRIPQQELLRKYFPGHIYVHSISIRKNEKYSPFSPEHWQGGLKIIFVSPNLKQLLWWGKEKIKTKLKYYFRK